MPQSSSVTEMNTPTSTSPHGRFWLRSPLMIVAINVAWGAGSDVDPIVMTECRASVVIPMTNDAVRTPMMRPTCCRTGVAPTRNPVFRSCEVAPAMAAAMQTTAPTPSAMGA